MKTITTSDLNTVTGGASKTDSAVTTQLAGLQSSIKDLAGNQNNNKSNDMLPLVMMMAMGNKQQGPTVVQTAAAPVVAGGPVVNISSRIGRRW